VEVHGLKTFKTHLINLGKGVHYKESVQGFANEHFSK
jgi:hypothetical protein